MPTLLIRGPDGTLVERELDGRLTVGCDDDNDLVLRSGGVEKRHANFFAEGGEVVLEELGLKRGRKRLEPGVRVLIGGYEVQVKPGEQRLSVRRVGGPSDTKVDAPFDTLVPPEVVTPFPYRLVLSGFGVALVALAAVGVWRHLDKQPVVAVEPPPELCPKLEEDLRIARSGPSPKALEAVDRALACDPINAEANALKRSIPKELEGQALVERAKELVDLQRDEQALEQLEKVPGDSEVSRVTALPLLREVAGRVLKHAKADCEAYGKAGKKALAESRCAEASRLEKLLAPLQPAAPKGPPLSERVLSRVHEPLLVEPLLLYANGRNAEAVAKLQALRERNDKAALHARADALRKDISNADGLYKVGERELEKGNLLGASRDFREALTLDARVLPEGDSVLKHNVESKMTAKAYELGAVQAQRQNWVEACMLWKFGFVFWKGNVELNSALMQDCTNRARAVLDSYDCKVLGQAQLLSVPGDGLDEELARRMSGLDCLARGRSP